MNKVRLGLVGCGRRGIYVGTLFRDHPKCRVTALCDRFETPIRNAMGEFKDAKTYRSFSRMLRDAPVDALFFASDPMEHADLSCVAMQAGKHVCTEVPAAVTMEQCWNLVRTVKKTGCKYQPLEQTRYWGFIDAWRKMRERGELGHVCLAQGEYVHYEEHWGYWIDRETGEIYRDLAPPRGRKVVPSWRKKMLANPIYYLPHTLSPLLKILDDRVLSVSCMGTRKGSHTYPKGKLPWSDIQYAVMHTAKDTVLLVGAGFSLPHVRRGGGLSAHWYELRGTRGSVTSPRSGAEEFQFWKQGMDRYEKMNVSAVPLGATRKQMKSGHGGADFKPVDTFVRAILRDTTPPLDVYKAVELTAPAILAAESARRGGIMLKVPDFRKGR